MLRLSALLAIVLVLAGCGAAPRAPASFPAPEPTVAAQAATTPEAAAATGVAPAALPTATPAVLVILPGGDPAPLLTALVGVPFEIPLGGEIAVGDTGITLGFSGVPEDSRCPENARCLWQGRAVVTLEILAAEQPIQTLTLAIPGDITPDAPELASVGPYTLRLVDLAPYPATPGGGPGPYVATLMLEQR